VILVIQEKVAHNAGQVLLRRMEFVFVTKILTSSIIIVFKNVQKVFMGTKFKENVCLVDKSVQIVQSQLQNVCLV
jgi:hypothetical protein